MSSIRILPDRIANQIAAGEVIERPVAVVKELVENSIDAGATRIEIEFRHGGKSYIRVEDNGKGMSPDEAFLCMERHATSKIRKAEDLDQISSFGFRGEALPSISSISRFTLRTRSRDWKHGTEIKINSGRLLEKKECGMPVGTVIEVAQLFNSVPARRKFLKTDPTETAHISYNTRLFAVAHPEIAFRLLESGRTIFQSPACNNLQDRIAEIWGHSLSNDLISVDRKDEKTGYHLTGLIAKPGVGRSTRRELVTLINRRSVNSRTLDFAILDAYHGQIPKGRYPPAFLFIKIPPKDVDVNVHPAKREVRFHNEGGIRRFVFGAIADTLAKINKRPITHPEPEPGDFSQVVPPKPVPVTTIPSLQKEAKSLGSPTGRPVAQSIEPRAPISKTELSTASKTRPTWRFITQLRKQYALFDGPHGLIMLHLRHADQRVRFEQILLSYEGHRAPSQMLLIPEPIELEPLASETLKKHLVPICEQGFQIEEFGRYFYRIYAIPFWLNPEKAEVFVRDMVDMLHQRGPHRKQRDRFREPVAKLAVEGSYRRNDPMSEQAIQQLAEDLLQCETPHTSPSGKPTFSEISWNEWERRFKNT